MTGRIQRHHKWALVAAAATAALTIPVTVHATQQPAESAIPAAAVCHARGQLPDPTCTPGVADPRVTQTNIGQTICVAGYTATVRPPQSYTSRLKRQQMTQYGFTDSISAHEEDHLISLELGGAPSDPKNLWPEPGKSPNAKDKVENLLHSRVCAGQITLAEAQRAIASDWTAVK